MKLLFNDPAKDLQPYLGRLKAAIDEVVSSNYLIGGPFVTELERDLRDFLGVTEVVSTASGTDSLVICLLALGTVPGDKVLVPTMTAMATVSAVRQVGAVPVFYDVMMDSSPNVDHLASLAKRNDLKAAIVVHLYGQAVSRDVLSAIDSLDIPIIEDCAQALGSTWENGHYVGTFGEFGCFSFYPTKNLGCFGDGGAISINKPNNIDAVRQIKEYGWNGERVSVRDGINSRLDPLQARLLIHKLKDLTHAIGTKRKLASLYLELLSQNKQVSFTQSRIGHSFHLFNLIVENRDGLLVYLRSNDIYPGIHYSTSPALNPSVVKYAESIPYTAEVLAKKNISLPMYTSLTAAEVAFVCETINRFYS